MSPCSNTSELTCMNVKCVGKSSLQEYEPALRNLNIHLSWAHAAIFPNLYRLETCGYEFQYVCMLTMWIQNLYKNATEPAHTIHTRQNSPHVPCIFFRCNTSSSYFIQTFLHVLHAFSNWLAWSNKSLLT